MNKKNITIDTEFFDDSLETALKLYNNEDHPRIEAKKASSVRDNNSEFEETNINSYRYQYVPDHIYPDDSQEHLHQYRPDSSNTRKLQAAHHLQDTLSRIMASLFIRCWQTLKGILPQYEYLLHKNIQLANSSQQISNQQYYVEQNPIYESYQTQQYESSKEQLNQTNLNSKQYVDSLNVNSTQNVFVNALNNSNSDRKAAILERQKRGITLDSLEKLKLNRSKSILKFQLPERDNNTNIVVENRKERILTANDGVKKEELSSKIQQIQQKQQISRLSGKSYRQKFLEYKHRSKSRDAQIGSAQLHSKYVTYNRVDPVRQHTTQFQQNLRVNQNGHYSLGNLNSNNTHYNSQYNISYRAPLTNVYESKNELLRNISDLLLDREDIYQGENYKYYLNHRDNGNNIYNHTFSYKNLGNSNNINTQYIDRTGSKNTYQYRPNIRTDVEYVEVISDGQKDVARAQLLEEIVEKLNYSKLRLQNERQKNKEVASEDELEMMRKITRLQKLVIQLKNETNSSRVSQERESNINLNIGRTQEDELYKRFIEEISSIRSQINTLKSTRAPSSVYPKSNQNQLILQQQKLLNNYQREYQRLINTNTRSTQNNTTVIREQVKPASVKQQSFFQKLIEQNQTSQKKSSWNEGWNVSTKQEQIISNIDKSRLQKRHEHLTRQQGRQVYRYTRNNVLSDFGYQAQIQEQNRALRANEARMTLDRQKRQEQIRIMTERVKLKREGQLINEQIDKNRSMRQKYEHEWEKYQQTRIDVGEGDDCCALFPCR